MFSEPALGEKFFGREDVLELLGKRVSALKDGYRQNIALTGQSLAGKSSIILHFLYTIKEEAFIPVYVEVVNEPFRSFSNKFISTMLYSAFHKMGQSASMQMRELIEKCEEALPRTHSAIKAVNSCIDRGDLDEAYSNLLGLTSVLKDEKGMSSIVILDEFDNLEHLGIKNPFLNFGKVIMVQKDTMYIVSSSRNSAIKKIISEKLSLLFGNFEVVKISNFDLATSMKFIDAKCAGFDIDPELKAFLITFSDGNPFYLDKIMGRSSEIALERMTSHIDKTIVTEAVVDLLFNAGGSIHQYLWNYILDLLDTKYREEYTAILTAIANGQRKQTDIGRTVKMKKNETTKALARLSEIGLVSKNGIFYEIDDTMLEFWLKHVYQRKKELVVNGAFDKTGIFTEDTASYISEYLKESAKSVSQRIAELFNAFSDELVQIESKQMRLPHFTKVEVRTFPDSKPYLAASFRGNFWIAQAYEHDVAENDIIDYIRNIKGLGYKKITNKVILPLKGVDENAKLLAKELRILIWDTFTINTLLSLYGKKKIVLI